VWALLEAFASFGFCKAHAAAFALPTYQSAWLKTHYPAHFLAGVLTHDPGMYPKRLILDDARQCGITVLGLDVNASDAVYRVERVDAARSGPAPVPDGRGFGIRMALAEVKGINEAEIARILTGRPFHSLPDFWHRARVSRPVAERLVLAGAFDALYSIGGPGRIRRRGGISRRDLLLQVTELDRAGRVADRYARGRRVQHFPAAQHFPVAQHFPAAQRPAAAQRSSAGQLSPAQRSVEVRGAAPQISDAHRFPEEQQQRAFVSAAVGAATAVDDPALPLGVRALAAAQARTAAPVEADPPMQLALHFPGDADFLDEADCPGDGFPDGSAEDGSCPDDGSGRVVRLPGLPELSDTERVRAELDILGMDVSRHVLDFYAPMLQAIGITRSIDLRKQRSRSELLVAGVKVATQTPPIRSGRRVVFLTLDDATGPVDATFFEDVQGPYAATVFSSWLLVVRGELRRTGPNGVSLRATGAWELSELLQLWNAVGTGAVLDLIDSSPAPGRGLPSGAGSVLVPDTDSGTGGNGGNTDAGPTAGGMGRRRVLVHPSGFRQSPYADVKPPGESTKAPPRKLWHSSPGSSGH
jgi:error-prone DNA polymerase